MNDATTSLVANVTAASATLRETTKWMVGGIVATAAAALAGSSLTNFGSLDPLENGPRFAAAVIGIVVGFVGLAILMHRALNVLTIDTITLRMLAEDSRLAKTAAILNNRYRGQLPGRAANLAALAKKVDNAFKKRIEPAAHQLLQEVDNIQPEIAADARFLELRAKFDSLAWWLRIAVPLVVLGFLMFAWAANPPKTSPMPEKQAVSVAISIGQGNSSAVRSPPKSDLCRRESC